jgi:hypothetical protein
MNEEILDDKTIPRLEEYDDGRQLLAMLPAPKGMNQTEWINALRKAAIFDCDWIDQMLDGGNGPTLSDSIFAALTRIAELEAKVRELEKGIKDEMKSTEHLLDNNLEINGRELTPRRREWLIGYLAGLNFQLQTPPAPDTGESK